MYTQKDQQTRMRMPQCLGTESHKIRSRVLKLSFVPGKYHSVQEIRSSTSSDLPS